MPGIRGKAVPAERAMVLGAAAGLSRSPPHAELASPDGCWQNACMSVQITVRNVPDRVRDSLADKARHERKSMQEYLLGELDRLAERPSPAQWLERVRQRKVETNTRLRPSEILMHRNADRR